MRNSKLTQEWNESISKLVREKYSLEVIHHLLTLPVCLQTLYNWVESGRLDVKTMLIRLIPDKTTRSVNQALEEIFQQQQIESIPSDNGLKFARLNEVFSKLIYYCHAYVSFERGTNENHNCLIRRFLPKGTKKTSKEEVQDIEYWINHYPKKMVQYKSPAHMVPTG